MKRDFFALALLLAFSSLPAVAQETVKPLHDYSHRVSLVDKKAIALFETGTDGFEARGGVDGVEVTDGKDFYPTVHEGKQVMMVRSKAVSGDTWRTIGRSFGKPLNLQKTPFIQFGIFARTAPVQDIFVKLTLKSGKESFDCMAHIIPTLWRTVAFDCTECKFLSKVDGMEIGLYSPTPDVWSDYREFLVDGIVAGAPIDFDFTVPQSTGVFRATNGKLSYADDALVYTFKKPGAVYTDALSGSINDIFSPPANERNTIRAVIDNRCGADSIRVSYTTDRDSVFRNHSKVFALSKSEGRKNYFFNMSDIPTEGNYAGIMFEPLGAEKGSMAIDRITFEREEPIRKKTGRILSCKADSPMIHIVADIGAQAAKEYKELNIYTLPLMHFGDFRKGRKVYSTQKLAAQTKIDDLPLMRTDRPGMTHLASRFVATLSNGREEVPIGSPFYIENWEDFTENPYDFLVTNEDFNVLDYGAKGDGFTDDTRAFQLAINAASGAGSGRVVVPGSDDPYGRRYVITSVELKHDVEFKIEKGAVLWQSGDRRDYDYQPLYGHDMVIPGIPWTHSHFVNKPLLVAQNQYRIKICGGGVIRMNDPYTKDPDIAHYATSCEDRIHIVPVVFSDCHDIVLQDFDIMRTNCYHTSLDNDSNLFVGNVKMYDAACVSGDGLGLSSGTHRVKIERCFFESNDDGVTLSSSYRDPRNNVSPWRAYHDLNPHGARNVTVEHSYFSSGGGKAIAVIPWGSTNPEPQNQIIDSVKVTDCILAGGYSVGTWPDNPFDGKPFDNSETDDFSTVQDFWIFNNEYVNECNLLCVTPTNFRNDCGIPSSSVILNGNFKDGRCYWSRRGNVNITRSGAEIKAGQFLFQGLTLKKGKYALTVKASGSGEIKAVNSENSATVASCEFAGSETKQTVLEFTIENDGDYMLGVEGGNAKVVSAELKKAD